MWFHQVPRDLDWDAPYVFRNEADLALSADEVFAIWADIDQWPKWFSDINRGTWTTEPPYGPGSERTVELKTLSVKERFLAWDPGKRYAFTMTACTLPLTWSIVEDYRLEPTETGCRFVWVVKHDLRWYFLLSSPIVRMVFGKMFRDATASLERYCAERAKQRAAG